MACAARIRKTAVGHGPKAADYQGPQISCLEGVEFNPEQLGTGSGSAGSAIVPTAGVGSGRGSAVIPAAWTAADNRQDATAGWMPMQRAGARCDRRAAQTAWAYNVAVPGLCGSSWFNLAGSASGTTLTIPVAGNYTVTCLASPPAMGGGVPVQVSVTFGVPAPTSLRGLSGTNVPTFPNSAVLALSLVMQSASQPSGPMLAAMVQENLYNFVWYGGATGGAGGWVPASPSANFYLAGGKVYDWMSFLTVGPVWAAIPVGTVLVSWSQDVRLVWSFMCADGTPQSVIAPLGTYNWSMVKTDASHWSLMGGP